MGSHLAEEGPEPQDVLNALSEAAVFLVVSAKDRPGAAERLRDVASDINGLVRAVGFRQSAKAMGSGPLSCVVGFGSSYWDRIRPAGSPKPAGLHPFRPLTGAVHDAPSTPVMCSSTFAPTAPISPSSSAGRSWRRSVRG